jgi:hypothetical protein
MASFTFTGAHNIYLQVGLTSWALRLTGGPLRGAGFVGLAGLLYVHIYVRLGGLVECAGRQCKWTGSLPVLSCPLYIHLYVRIGVPK